MGEHDPAVLLRGNKPYPLERLLRLYLPQIWSSLSDPAAEDAIYDSYAMRKFTGIDFMTKNVPDETTLCKFRHLLEKDGLNKLFFDAINRVTAANEYDVTAAAKFIRKDDEVVYGDSGYLGLQKRPEIQSDAHLSAIEYRINRRPGKLPKVSDNAIDWERYIENRKSSTRCKVEHLFHIIKCQFGYTKTRYGGLMKNGNRLYVMFACANLYMLAMAGRSLR